MKRRFGRWERATIGSANWKDLFDQAAAGLAGLELLGTILGLILVLKSYRRVV
jgi:hypothetical protein